MKCPLMGKTSQPKRPVTIKDLANRLKLSTATISLALRNHPRISTTTRERVRATADKLGYKPNPMVSSLMARISTGRENNQGVVLAWLNCHRDERFFQHPKSFNHGLFQGAYDRAEELGYTLEEFYLKTRGMTMARMQQILETRGITGLIIPPLPAARGHLRFKWEQFTSVAIGHSMARPQLHRVSPDQYHNIRLAIRKLVHAKKSRIGLALLCVDGRPNTDNRLDNRWSAAYAQYQMGLPSKQRIPVLYYQPEERAKVRRWFERYQPQAILGDSPCVKWYLEEIGLPNGSTYHLVQLDWAEEQTNFFATVDQQPRQVGAAAVDLLTAQLQRNERGIPETPKLVEIPGVWRMEEA